MVAVVALMHDITVPVFGDDSMAVLGMILLFLSCHLRVSLRVSVLIYVLC